MNPERWAGRERDLEQRWQPAEVFNLFRAALAWGLLLVVVLLPLRTVDDYADPHRLLRAVAGYAVLPLIWSVALRLRWPRFEVLVSLMVVGDISFLLVMMDVATAHRTGIGLLLLPFLAAAGLVSRGRMTLFHAALATIGLFLQHAWSLLNSEGAGADLFQTAMLASACFATAWLAYRLARFAVESEQLAEHRGKELANMAEINRLILKDVSDGVLVLDSQDRVRECNLQAQRLLGGAEGLLGKKLGAVNAGLSRALDEWRGERTGVPPTLAPHSRIRPRFMAVATGRSASGTVVFLEDIERLRQEALKLKLAALGRLTANIAHEIRNPLSAIRHAAELLAESLHDPADQRLTAIVGDNVQRLDRMVREILELNRRDRADPVQIALAVWLEHFVGEFVSVGGLPEGAVVLEVPPNARVCFDSGQLHQVVWNLCRNGWRHSTQQTGSLRLTVQPAPSGWALDVMDDGPGVPAEDQNKLFEPFFTTDSKGTGLGLYIARELCAGNGGTLDYRGSSPSCFRVVMPEKT